ncbi:hypothetical protein [Salegentibacter mishustinae]|uniref:hypothetical protein n=1 Tax=Salegentibacter mishustinae TaxID=270918 RepID=UPI0024932474|nr:hypothetical protein [Salegentibacter mishustinae]
MLGIELYDTREPVENLGHPIVAEKPGIVKYQTDNGNELSVTFENDKVVYLENDWLFSSEGKDPLVTDFTFGKTSIAEIREEFETNGFTYSNRLYSATATHLVTFNCFELDTNKNEVLITITGVPIAEKNQINEDNLSEKLKLLAIIIADKKYLDKIWGEEKVFDDDYKKIQLEKV